MTICAVLCDEGFEHFVLKELKQRFKVSNISITPTMVLFDANFEICAKISYVLQSAIKVLYGVTSFKIDSLESSTSIHDDAVAFAKEKIVAVRCVRKGTHTFNSVDFAKVISERHFTTHAKDFKKPEVEILCYIKNDAGYIGVDIAGRVLSKRDYKIFFGPTTLRGTIAYGVVSFANISSSDVILDPFMGSGTIIIEDALRQSNTSPFYFSKEAFLFRNRECPSEKSWNIWFDKIDSKRDLSKKNILGFDSLLKYLKYAQKNAKIADVQKVVHISKCDIDWLDTKLDKHSITAIVTNPPGISKMSSLRNMLKLYVDFFKQAHYLLTENGKISVIVSNQTQAILIQAATKVGFICIEQIPVFEGQQELFLVKYVRNPEVLSSDDDADENEDDDSEENLDEDVDASVDTSEDEKDIDEELKYSD